MGSLASDDSTSPQRRGPDASAIELFELLPLPEHAKQDLLERMTAPDRHYHGLAHLGLLWDRHRRFAPTAGLRETDHVPVALAIAFHDAIYDSDARDNEARSAALWLSVCAGAAICSDADRSWVAETILATTDHLAAAAALDLDRPDHRARQWVLDLDLTPLGETPEVFDANLAALAAEMPGDTTARREEKLMASLRRFAGARPLYKSRPLRDAFEASARANMARHLAVFAAGDLPSF